MHHSFATPQQMTFPPHWNVPRGTYENILIFSEALKKWNGTINLISASELESKHFWQRHVLDSLQLTQFINPQETICDIGSGAGFPALMLAAAGYKNITLIESDVRKCQFLQEASRQMNVPAHIVNARAENTRLPGAPQVITARALTDVTTLLNITAHLMNSQTRLVLLKGEHAADEIKQAEQHGGFDHELSPSHTDPKGRIVIIRNLHRKAS